MTDDPIMNNIFKDTAATTLQEQIRADSNRPSVKTGGDQAALIVDASSPQDLFGEASNKWAALAFADPINK